LSPAAIIIHIMGFSYILHTVKGSTMLHCKLRMYIALPSHRFVLVE